MKSYFLLQVNNSTGYPDITNNHIYRNPVWSGKSRDSDQQLVEPHDTVLVYCTADVSSYPMSLAFQVEVTDTSPDHVTLHLGEPQWFRHPLKRERILQLIDAGALDEVFRSCGVQGFNICRLEPPMALGILEFLQGAPVGLAAQAPLAAQMPAGGSPLDSLIETKLEDWLVEHWSEVHFFSKLKLYEEKGEVVGQQFDTHEVGRIDLLCEEEESADLVVIELKRGRPSDEVVGQLARYIGWTQRNLANGRRVRGIVLAPEFDPKLRYAAAAIPDTTLLRYQTRFEVSVET